MLRESLPKIVTQVPGPKARAVLERRARVVPAQIKCPYPLVIDRGEGAMIRDVDGNVFLDWVAGVSVLNVGYSHPAVLEAVLNQASRFFHGMMGVTTHEPYIALAEKMNALVPVRGSGRKTMFINSGAEAIENAVKIARSATGRPNIVVFSGAFHGRTLLTMTMTAKKSYSIGTGPFPDGIIRAEYPYVYRAPEMISAENILSYYIDRLRRTFEEAVAPETVAAVVLEPVQGEGGFVPAPFEWVKALRELCDRHGILMIADEIQTGFARSGKFFVANYWSEAGFEPDIIASAKSIAAGIPLSAVTASAEVFDRVRPGIIGGTFGGNALACSAALAVIGVIEKEKLCERSAEIAKRCRSAFESWKDKYTQLGDVRGIGCMMGLEFVADRKTKKPAPELVEAIIQEALANGLVVENAGTFGNVIRFLSPLVISDAQIEKGLEILESAIAVCCAHYDQSKR